MPSRYKHDRAMSLQQFEKLFPDEDACARHLVKLRWGDGFVCPACGGTKGWELKGDRCRRECADCGRQTSVTAGTVMHRTHLPLKTWFLAAHIVATHSNGISALQLQAQLGIGSYKSAWLLLQKLRRAMVDPDRSVLQEIVEVDEASMPFREGRGAEGRSKKGRSAEGKMLLAGAVELSEDGKPRRIRLKEIDDYSADSLQGFIADVVEPGAQVVTDGWSGYSGLPGNPHEARVIGDQEAHKVLEWAHRVFSNLKRWAMGVYHGLRRKHFQKYLDEFVFRWNRRRHRATSFDRLLGIGLELKPVTYRDFVEGRA
ncbi:MAG: IS1595 family transposase [Chloroflexi bacterium]|nr:IS1595 family transposase [Chloroflexota bacterium]